MFTNPSALDSRENGRSMTTEPTCWEELQVRLGLRASDLLHASRLDRGRRVYCHEDKIFKVVALLEQETHRERNNDLCSEFRILQHASSVSGIPQAREFFRLGGYEILIMEKIDAHPLDQCRLTVCRWLCVFVRLAILLLRLSWKGIKHNDITRGNVLVSGYSHVHLIDFDQATSGGFWSCLRRNFCGARQGEIDFNNHYFRLVRRSLKNNLSPVIVSRIQRLRRLSGRGNP